MPPETSDPIPDVARGPLLPAAIGRLLGADLDDPVQVHGLVEALEAEIGLVVAGLVLYGSAARREPAPGDIDALVVTALPAAGGLWGRSGEVELDLHVIGLDALLGSRAAEWPHLVAARAVHDATGRIGPWLRALAEAGPPPLAPSRRLREREWARRMLARVERHRRSDPGLAALRAAELVSMLPELQMAVTGQPRGSVGTWWKEQGEPMRSLIHQWTAGPLTDEGFEALCAMVSSIEALESSAVTPESCDNP